MVFAHQIRGTVSNYLANVIDAKAFLLQFSSLSYNIRKRGDAEAIRLADKIESLLVDARSGCIAELQLRSILRELIYANVVNSFNLPPSFACSVNQISMGETAFLRSPATSDTLRGVVFGPAMPLPS